MTGKYYVNDPVLFSKNRLWDLLFENLAVQSKQSNLLLTDSICSNLAEQEKFIFISSGMLVENFFSKFQQLRQVFKESPILGIWGGTLDLHKNSGQKAMKIARLLEEYYWVALPMGISVTDKQGRILCSKTPTPENQFENPEINRNDLHKLLIGSLQVETVFWENKVLDVKVHNGKWLLHVENKPDATADVVIVANGGMSRVRSYVTDAEAEETGTYIIQGDVDEPEINCSEF